MIDMNKYKSISFVVAFILLANLGVQHTQASLQTTPATSSQMQSLLTQLQNLQNQLKAKKDNKQTCSTKPNIFVGEISMDKDVLSGNSLGNALPQQVLKVKASTDVCLSANFIGDSIKYTVVVYESKTGKDPEIGRSSGAFSIASTSQVVGDFEVYVTGGSAYIKEKFEREYYAVVKIDTANSIKETKETDNVMTSNKWVMEYYKG